MTADRPGVVQPAWEPPMQGLGWQQAHGEVGLLAEGRLAPAHQPFGPKHLMLLAAGVAAAAVSPNPQP